MRAQDAIWDRIWRACLSAWLDFFNYVQPCAQTCAARCPPMATFWPQGPRFPTQKLHFGAPDADWNQILRAQDAMCDRIWRACLSAWLDFFRYVQTCAQTCAVRCPPMTAIGPQAPCFAVTIVASGSQEALWDQILRACLPPGIGSREHV